MTARYTEKGAGYGGEDNFQGGSRKKIGKSKSQK